MAKLYFRHGPMNSGKSTALLMAADNYERDGNRVLLAKPKADTKADSKITSRLGAEREVDLLISSEMNLLDEFRSRKVGSVAIDCLLIDEVQFITPAQVDDLRSIVDYEDVPVLAYGLRTDSSTRIFPSSLRLVEVADKLQEIITVCSCKKKATFNARKVNGVFVSGGPQVVIDNDENVSYVPLCSKCYRKYVGDPVLKDG